MAKKEENHANVNIILNPFPLRSFVYDSFQFIIMQWTNYFTWESNKFIKFTWPLIDCCYGIIYFNVSKTKWKQLYGNEVHFCAIPSESNVEVALHLNHHRLNKSNKIIRRISVLSDQIDRGHLERWVNEMLDAIRQWSKDDFKLTFSLA